MIQPGDRIGDWIIMQPLGAGGMGSIFAARSVLSERVKAACKVMHTREGFATRDRFIREVDTLATMNHPNVVRVLSGGDDPTREILYLFMEYLEGEDLRKRLNRGPMSAAEAFNVFRQVGSGLHHAHERGVTHRDIKPANIMLLNDGTAKLVDFGIAAAEGRTQLTREGTLPGTLPYIDPCAFSGDKPDFKLGDIYALGVTLWESLAGRMAFPEEPDMSAGQQMVRMMRLKMESVALDPGPAFPDPLRRLVKRATEPEPAQRLATMGEFLEQLNRSFTGRPEISAVSTGAALPPPLPSSGEPAPRSGGFKPTSSVADVWQPGRSNSGLTQDGALGGPATAAPPPPPLGSASPAPRAGPGSAGVEAPPTAPPVAPPRPGPASGGVRPGPTSGGQRVGSPSGGLMVGAPQAPPARRSVWPLVLVAAFVLFSCGGMGLLWMLYAMSGVATTSEDVLAVAGDGYDVGASSGDGADTTSDNPFAVNVNIPNPVVTTMTTDSGAAADTAKIGEAKTFGPYHITVKGVRRASSLSHEVFRHQAQSGWDLLLVKVLLENTSPGDVSLMSPFTVIDNHPYQFTQNISCQLALEGALESILTVPGRGRVMGEVCFEVAKDATGLKLRFQPDMMNQSWNLQVALDR